MIKQLFFSLLFITNTLTHGMEKIILDENCDEKTLQTNIDAYAHTHGDSHCIAAKMLMRTNDCYRPIYEKINRLFDIAYDQNQQFTEEDLGNPWYVNATKSWMGSHETKSTLLTTAYKANPFDIPLHKIRDLLHAKIDVKNNINNYLLTRIYFVREKIIESKQNLLSKNENMPTVTDNNLSLSKTMVDPIIHQELQLTQLLTAAELLLKHGADPDFKIPDEYYTPLMFAVLNTIDPEYAHLLVWYNANPCKTTILQILEYNVVNERTLNSFDLEKTGWLKKMVDNKQQTIFKYLLFKHHNLEELTLLQEIVNLIRYKVWEVGKNSYKTIEGQTKITLSQIDSKIIT